jgi:glutaredoxin 3
MVIYAADDLGASAIFYEVMHRITIYTTDPCSFCARVKGLLQTHGAEFSEVNLTKDPDGRAELVLRTGMMSFPQVLLDGQLLGGFAELLAAAESGELERLLSAGGAESGAR